MNTPEYRHLFKEGSNGQFLIQIIKDRSQQNTIRWYLLLFTKLNVRYAKNDSPKMDKDD